MTPSADFGREALSRLEDDWLSSRIRGEAEIDHLSIDDNYQGVTSDGLVQGKGEFMLTVQAEGGKPIAGQHVERNMRAYGDVVISTGRAVMRSERRVHSFRYLRVFRKVGDGWLLIASQSTRLV